MSYRPSSPGIVETDTDAVSPCPNRNWALASRVPASRPALTGCVMDNRNVCSTVSLPDGQDRGPLPAPPTCYPPGSPQDDRYTILSGNHRVKAAKDAGLTEVTLLYTDRELTHAQQVAIQLAHNAIAGQDDLAILRELYDEINDVALKEYSGLDDVLLGKLNPPDLDPLSEKGLDYRIVSIAFLPERPSGRRCSSPRSWSRPSATAPGSIAAPTMTGCSMP
jgi:hypothetical protein